MTGTIDPITTEVIARYLLATAEEMGATLMHAAFSPNIKERGDCSTAVFDARGRVIAQAHRVPIHLGSMIGMVDAVLARVPVDEIRPGDMFLANDPYHGGGTHLPDLTVIAPVFRNGRIVAYVANIAHHADIGGMVPGSESSMCRNIFQEGLRIPPVRILRQGRLAEDVFAIVMLNSRTPDERSGDLRAQFAANHTGLQRVSALIDRYGADVFHDALAAYLDFTERRFVAAIGQLNPGVYRGEELLDAIDPPVPIRLALTVEEGRLHFDFTGTARQAEGGNNIPWQALMATIYAVAKSLLDPDIPANAGYYRTMTVTAPPGSLVNPLPPAAVGTRSQPASMLGDLLAAMLSEARPELGIACSGPHHLMLLSGRDPRTDSYFVHYETMAGGGGAQADRDGQDAVRSHGAGSANLPVEVLEHAIPFRIERYALWDGSGGDGTYRGGTGLVRDYRVLGEDVTVSLSSSRQRVAAAGMKGGLAGACGRFVLDPGTSKERVLPTAVAEVPLPKGSVLSIRTPGGGGFGSPDRRDPALVARDAREGRVAATGGGGHGTGKRKRRPGKG